MEDERCREQQIRLIKKKISTHYKNLKALLDGLNDFTGRMISNGLIPETFRKAANFDAIIEQFWKTLKSSISVKDTYNTFITVIREVKMNDMADNLVIQWSAQGTRQSGGRLYSSTICNTSCFSIGYRTKPLQARDSDVSLQSQSEINMVKNDYSHYGMLKLTGGISINHATLM